MTQEELKELLLKDLTSRLPHGVMLKHISTEKPFKLFSIKRDEYASYKNEGVELAVNGIYYDWYVNDAYHDIELYIKPYLFPLSSITDDQEEELKNIYYSFNGMFQYTERIFDKIPFRKMKYFPYQIEEFFNKNHIDYRGLIPMGLAIDATGLNIY